jgi:hypothetical protein
VEGKVQFWKGNCVKCAEGHDSEELCSCVDGKPKFLKRCDCCRLHLKFFGRSGPSKEDVNRALYRMSLQESFVGNDHVGTFKGSKPIPVSEICKD